MDESAKSPQAGKRVVDANAETAAAVQALHGDDRANRGGAGNAAAGGAGGHGGRGGDSSQRFFTTPPSEPEPRRIGPYRIHHRLGAGGMGIVYLATRDDDQFNKRVAVKVIKRGMD